MKVSELIEYLTTQHIEYLMLKELLNNCQSSFKANSCFTICRTKKNE